MRIATYNIGGAFVPGRRDAALQSRSWHRLAAMGVDLAFLQEVEGGVVPSWYRRHWALVRGHVGRFDKRIDWGSVIAAAPALKLRDRSDLMQEHDWLRMLFDYVVVGEVMLPDGESAFVASVHAPATTVVEFLAQAEQPEALSVAEIEELRLGKEAYVVDLAFEALDRAFAGQRFIVGGDFNSARLFDRYDDDSDCQAWFRRCRSRGWCELHYGNEVRTWLHEGHKPYQLDHVFADAKTAAWVTSSRALDDALAWELSDHAPLVVEMEVG